MAFDPAKDRTRALSRARGPIPPGQPAPATATAPPAGNNTFRAPHPVPAQDGWISAAPADVLKTIEGMPFRQLADTALQYVNRSVALSEEIAALKKDKRDLKAKVEELEKASTAPPPLIPPAAALAPTAPDLAPAEASLEAKYRSQFEALEALTVEAEKERTKKDAALAVAQSVNKQLVLSHIGELEAKDAVVAMHKAGHEETQAHRTPSACSC